MKMLSSLIALATLGPAFGGDGSKSVLPASTRVLAGWSLQSISAGLAWRQIGSLNYRGSTHSANLMIPSVVGGNVLSAPAIGSSLLASDRSYNNGFVNVDSTGSSNGDTWFWGYDSSSQIQGDLLSFNATGSRSVFSETSALTGNTSKEDHLNTFSPQIDFVFAPPSNLNLPFDGLLLSFWAFSEDRNHRFSNFRAVQTRDDFRTDYIDRYDVSAITPVISAPYAGNANGPGPIISNLPFSREETESLINSESAVFSNSISTSLDLNGYSLALGPTWQGSFSRNWSWQASAGVTLNLFKWDAQESETLLLSQNGASSSVYQQWRDESSGTDFSLGVYAKGEVIRHLTDQWFATAYLQAEVAQSIEIKVGQSKYEFKPRGVSFGFSMGHQF